MAFGLKLRKYPKAEIEQRVLEAAEILSISHLLSRKPKHLSGGERQRVAVGRAIVRHPKVFLFDEPLSNLDAKLRVQMRMELSRLHDRLNATIVYVTHDQVEAMTMGDQIVVLNEGKIQQIADPGTLYHNPANRFVGGFIGTPPMNFIETRIRAEKLQFEGFEVQLTSHLREKLQGFSGDAVTLGIRPEDIRVQGEARNTVETQVELVEPLGNHVLLYLRAGDSHFIAQSEGANTPRHNALLTVHFEHGQSAPVSSRDGGVVNCRLTNGARFARHLTTPESAATFPRLSEFPPVPVCAVLGIRVRPAPECPRAFPI